MIVNVLERLVLLKLLPEKANLLTMVMVNDLKNQLGFTDEELTLLNFQELPNGGTKWSAEGAERCTKDVKFGVNGCALIKSQLQQLDDAEELAIEHLSLWEKFVDGDKRVIHGGKE